MNCFIVTSTLTFVPRNYEAFVAGMADAPQVQGIIFIENRQFSFLLKALMLILTLAAPRFGVQLLINFFSGAHKRKVAAYRQRGKKVYFVTDINAPQTLKILHDEKVDLLLNARTRSFFKKSLLAAPTYGCINIHHGLLPHQRGLMCDFWAHFYKTEFGFSIHQMTSKLDDGTILKVHAVHREHGDYLASIFQASQEEVPVAKEVLAQIEQSQQIKGEANAQTQQTVYRSNPGLTDFYKLQSRGTKI